MTKLPAPKHAEGKPLKRPGVLFDRIYGRLFKEFGRQYWWPGETPIEIIVGAILTQNTNWSNVEKAINNLKREKVLSTKKLKEIPASKLALLIKPSGYFNIKAKRLKNFIAFLFKEYRGHLDAMAAEPLGRLRKKILAVNGIGPETADSILLYALNKPVFVVDAYTKRFLYRHNLVDSQADYHGIQDLFMQNVKPSVARYNEYHALIVHLGKHFCKTKPLCEQCPMNRISYALDKKCMACHRHLPSARGRVPRCRHCRTLR